MCGVNATIEEGISKRKNSASNRMICNRVDEEIGNGAEYVIIMERNAGCRKMVREGGVGIDG